MRAPAKGRITTAVRVGLEYGASRISELLSGKDVIATPMVVIPLNTRHRSVAEILANEIRPFKLSDVSDHLTSFDLVSPQLIPLWSGFHLLYHYRSRSSRCYSSLDLRPLGK
jgi:hypothetical protein